MSSIQPFVPRELGPKPWGSELLVAHTEQYTGKVLRMNAGHAGGLQYHERKDETFYLVEGEAEVTYDPGEGALVTVHMVHGEAYRVPPGAVHQVRAITDCVLFEASTPAFDDRVDVSDRYGASNGQQA